MSEQSPSSTDSKSKSHEQLLTFIVNGEEYGVDILRVQEIRGWSNPMPIPNTPSYVKGVINIRGDIVPIADLRERLGLEQRGYGATTAVVVLRVMQGPRQRIMGVVVDAMSDVTNVPVTDIKPPPDFGDDAGAGLAKGIATLAEKMVTILDVDRIFLAPGGAAVADAAA